MIRFEIVYTPRSAEQRRTLESDPGKARVWKAVRKTLAMEADLRLRTHKFHSQKGPRGRDVFEACAQNHTPGDYRIFWCYGTGTKNDHSPSYRAASLMKTDIPSLTGPNEPRSAMISP